MKINIKAILISTGGLLFLNTAIMAILTNFNLGFIICLAVALAIFFYGLFCEKLNKIKWLKYLFFGGLSAMLSLMAFICVYGKMDNINYAEDALIVLGAGIKGENVTITLAHRLDKAVEYFEENPDAIIVVSGGQGYQETISEALAMENYLIQKGIPSESIIKEDKSTSTYENCLFSKQILDEFFDTPYKTAVITNDFHIYRAMMLSDFVGLKSTHYHSKTEWYMVSTNYIRECAAVLKTWIFKK